MREKLRTKLLLGTLAVTTFGACGEAGVDGFDAEAVGEADAELKLAGCPSDGQVIKVFDGCNFSAGTQWAAQCYGVGTHVLRAPIDNDISSIKVKRGYQVQLFDGPGGVPLATLAANGNLCSGTATDKASRLIVSRVPGSGGSGGSGGSAGGPSGGGGASGEETPEPTESGADPAITTSINGGEVTITPSDDAHVKRSGRFFFQGNEPFYIAGAGGPEGFLYESAARKQQIIDELKARGARGIYFHFTRAFGGDGNNNGGEHLFKSNTNKALDAAKLQSVATFMDQLDQAGILMWANLLDDHSKPWGCFNSQNSQDYETYAMDLARAFKGYKHLIWVMKEEYDWNDCTHTENSNLVKTMAAAVRSVDSVHAIATHHMNGDSFDFSGDANIDVFGQQTGDDGEGDSVDHMHDIAGAEGWASGVAYVMAEAHPYHKNLIKAGSSTEMRQSLWATAFAGGSTLMYDAYECHSPSSYSTGAWLCSGPNAGADPAQPKPEMLDALRRLRRFMQSTRYPEMTPLFGAALRSRVAQGTRWILANDSKGLYALYGSSAASSLAVTAAPAGTYVARWYDPTDGVPGELTGGASTNHAGGTLAVTKPTGLGAEAAVYLEKQP